MPSLTHKNRATSLSQTLGAICQFIFSPGLLIMAFAMKILELYGQYVFVFTWGLNAITTLCNSLAVMWSPNKNMQRTGNLTANWVDFSISTLMMFGAAFIGASAFFPFMASMLCFVPFVCLIKSCWYGIKLLQAEDEESSEKYYELLQNNVILGIFSCFFSAAVIALFFMPGLPAVLTITIAIVLSTIVIPAAIAAIYTEVVKFTNWINNRINKSVKNNNHELDDGLSIKPVLRLMAELPQDQEKQTPLFEVKYNQYDDLIKKISDHIELLNADIRNSAGLFQEGKRLHKIQALEMLKNILHQWNYLFSQDLNIDDQYHRGSIQLSGNIIIDDISNLHKNPYSNFNKEKIIKRIKQHVFSTWPDAFQSFFKDQGQVELLFEQSFDYMRSMKSEHEISRGKDEIREEISACKKTYNNFYGKFAGEKKKAEHASLMRSLKNMITNKNTNNFFTAKLKNQYRDYYKIYQRIRSLHQSEEELSQLKGRVGLLDAKSSVKIVL